MIPWRGIGQLLLSLLYFLAMISIIYICYIGYKMFTYEPTSVPDMSGSGEISDPYIVTLNYKSEFTTTIKPSIDISNFDPALVDDELKELVGINEQNIFAEVIEKYGDDYVFIIQQTGLMSHDIELIYGIEHNGVLYKLIFTARGYGVFVERRDGYEFEHTVRYEDYVVDRVYLELVE